MKLFKLIPWMALALAVTVNAAMADVGKVSADNKDNLDSMCQFSPAAAARKTAGAKEEPKAAPAKVAEPVAKDAAIAM